MSKNDAVGRAKLIANPGAGDGKNISAQLEEVVHCLSAYGMGLDIALAQPVEEAFPIAKKAVNKGYSTVIGMGGDHTITAVARGLAGSQTRLGIIPAGTQNDIAASLGIPEDLNEACAIIASGNTRTLDLGQVNIKGRKKFIFFMVTAIGLTATIYPDIKDVPHGDFSDIKDAILTFLEFKTNPKVYLTLDDESKLEVETMLITVANTPLVGVKNLVAPNASMEDGLLDIAVYPNFSKAELLAYFAKTAHERVTADEKIQRYQARKIKIKASPKLDVAAEGTLLGKGTARIKALPGALHVIAPEEKAAREQPEQMEELLVPVSPSIEATQRNAVS